jgi:TRAP transporter TAXI family solute receptor
MRSGSWIINLCLLLVLSSSATAVQQETTLFRIGTGGVGGTYYPIGGLVALAISNPLGSRLCDEGGSCGVPGLLAIAQSSNGSVANVWAIEASKLESGFAQSDVAYWAYTGSGTFRGKAPVTNLRAITSLYPESIHLVARKGVGIRSVRDLRGKRVSLDEPGSGTLIDATLVLEAYGLGKEDIRAEYIKPVLASKRLQQHQLDAFFIVAGYPAHSVSSLTEESGAILIPIDGPEAERLVQKHRFFSRDTIPAGTYPGIGTVPTLTVDAQWITSSTQSERLIYQVTKAIWNGNSHKLLNNGHVKGKSISLDSALKGIAIPLHPGAERFYREAGMMAHSD